MFKNKTNWKKVLITGGAGYIGAAAVRHLISLDYEVYVLDNLIQGANGVKCFYGYKPYNFIKGDIRDKKIVDEIVKKVDYVVHLAALVGESACKKNPGETKSVNIDGTKNIVNACIKHKIQRLIFLSTCSSYGVQDTSIMAHEETPLNPVSLYAESKISMEEYIKKNYNNDFSYTILRPSTVHGLSPRMRFDLIVNHFVKDSIINGKLDIFGAELWRPLMWVGEVGRAIHEIFSCDLKLVKNQVFNLGNTRENRKKREVAEIIKNKFLPQLEIKYSGQDQDLRSYKVDFSKIEKKLNFKLEKSLEKAIEEIIFSIKNNLFDNPNSPEFKN